MVYNEKKKSDEVVLDLTSAATEFWTNKRIWYSLKAMTSLWLVNMLLVGILASCWSVNEDKKRAPWSDYSHCFYSLFMTFHGISFGDFFPVDVAGWYAAMITSVLKFMFVLICSILMFHIFAEKKNQGTKGFNFSRLARSFIYVFTAYAVSMLAIFVIARWVQHTEREVASKFVDGTKFQNWFYMLFLNFHGVAYGDRIVSDSNSWSGPAFVALMGWLWQPLQLIILCNDYFGDNTQDDDYIDEIVSGPWYAFGKGKKGEALAILAGVWGSCLAMILGFAGLWSHIESGYMANLADMEGVTLYHQCVYTLWMMFHGVTYGDVIPRKEGWFAVAVMGAISYIALLVFIMMLFKTYHRVNLASSAGGRKVPRSIAALWVFDLLICFTVAGIWNAIEGDAVVRQSVYNKDPDVSSFNLCVYTMTLAFHGISTGDVAPGIVDHYAWFASMFVALTRVASYLFFVSLMMHFFVDSKAYSDQTELIDQDSDEEVEEHNVTLAIGDLQIKIPEIDALALTGLDLKGIFNKTVELESVKDGEWRDDILNFGADMQLCALACCLPCIPFSGTVNKARLVSTRGFVFILYGTFWILMVICMLVANAVAQAQWVLFAAALSGIVALIGSHYRTKLRNVHGIEGEPWEDCLAHWVCAPCAIAQESRHCEVVQTPFDEGFEPNNRADYANI